MTRIGVVYPQTEYSFDPGAIRDYVQTVEALGFSHILAYSHVLGANPDRPGGWQRPYTYNDPFMSPLVLFSFMASATERIEFTTGIIILPQRQTALFAKQAATLDVLSSGRLRIGIGIGWNALEYDALNQDFSNRGQRVEEQVSLLRELWTQSLVEFQGRWHQIPDAGINPLPIQRPIPIWFGGHHENVLKRVASIGDGWMPNYRSPTDAIDSLQRLDQYLEAAGRKWSDIGLEVRIRYGDGKPINLQEVISQWEEIGATHMSVNTMGNSFTSPDEHLKALEIFAQASGIE